MEASLEGLLGGWRDVEVSYQGLPTFYLWLLALWFLPTFYWAINVGRNRHSQQLNNLHCAWGLVSFIKVLQLGMSFLFWHSCLELETCSLWMSFGVYASGILFQTASFVSFLLTALGYCITREHLSVKEQRKAASLGGAVYLTLVLYKAEVPYSTVFMLLGYSLAFYLIFRHLSWNLVALGQQLSLISPVQDDDAPAMHSAMRMKYTMVKKFQGTMQAVAFFEIVTFMNVANAVDEYWFRLLAREWVVFCIFVYVGWIFRPQQVPPLFFVMPVMKCGKDHKSLPPVYSLEIDAAEFRDLASRAWQIGVPTSLPRNIQQNVADSVVVVVQNPRSAKATDPI